MDVIGLIVFIFIGIPLISAIVVIALTAGIGALMFTVYLIGYIVLLPVTVTYQLVTGRSLLDRLGMR